MNIIFDLGGVLVNRNVWYIYKKLGYKTILKYLLKMREKPDKQFKQRMYHVLERIRIDNNIPNANTCGSQDYQESVLPGLLADWLKGSISCAHLRSLVLPYVQHNNQWFINKVEQRLMYNLLTLMFTPLEFQHIGIFCKQGLNFVQTCKQQGHRIFVLSNWDGESFTFLYQQKEDIFDLFDDLVISGLVGMIKPSPEIFQTYFTSKYKPESCIFIDDQEDNLNAARSLGMHALQYQSKQRWNGSGICNFTQVSKEIEKIAQQTS